MPSVNLAFYKKTRKEYGDIIYEYKDTISVLDREVYAFGLDDRSESESILYSLRDLLTSIQQLSKRISIMLEVNELKEKSYSEYRDMLKNLNFYELDVNSLIKEITEVLER